jgi:hypothetical protein
MAKAAFNLDFEATIHRPADGGDWLFLRLPQGASDQLPSRGMVSVQGQLDKHEIQTHLHPDGEGGHWLKIESSLHTSAKLSPGRSVNVHLTPSDVELEPEIPEDLQTVLDAHPAAHAVWKDITPASRRDWIQWLTSGKKAETRTIRLNKMTDMLSHGKRRICCFDRSGKYGGGTFTCPTAADEK